MGASRSEDDLGEFSVLNPPSTPFDPPTGLQYALDVYRGGYLENRRRVEPAARPAALNHRAAGRSRQDAIEVCAAKDCPFVVLSSDAFARQMHQAVRSKTA